MSYSLDQKCWVCKKQEKCMDGTIVSSAVAIIHTLGTAKGHLGAGYIRHECFNFVDRNAPEEVDTAQG